MAHTYTCVEYMDVDGTSDEMTTAMRPGTQYYIKGNVDFFYKIGATGLTAVADTAANQRCTAGVLYPICNLIDSNPTTTNGYIAIISDGISGDVELYLEEYGSAR